MTWGSAIENFLSQQYRKLLFEPAGYIIKCSFVLDKTCYVFMHLINYWSIFFFTIFHDLFWTFMNFSSWGSFKMSVLSFKMSALSCKMPILSLKKSILGFKMSVLSLKMSIWIQVRKMTLSLNVLVLLKQLMGKPCRELSNQDVLVRNIYKLWCQCPVLCFFIYQFNLLLNVNIYKLNVFVHQREQMLRLYKVQRNPDILVHNIYQLWCQGLVFFLVLSIQPHTMTTNRPTEHL